MFCWSLRYFFLLVHLLLLFSPFLYYSRTNTGDCQNCVFSVFSAQTGGKLDFYSQIPSEYSPPPTTVLTLPFICFLNFWRINVKLCSMMWPNGLDVYFCKVIYLNRFQTAFVIKMMDYCKMSDVPDCTALLSILLTLTFWNLIFYPKIAVLLLLFYFTRY